MICSNFMSHFLFGCMSPQINNNLRCYDLAMELSNSTMEALPPNYAEQVMWIFPFYLFIYYYHYYIWEEIFKLSTNCWFIPIMKCNILQSFAIYILCKSVVFFTFIIPLPILFYMIVLFKEIQLLVWLCFDNQVGYEQ